MQFQRVLCQILLLVLLGCFASVPVFPANEIQSDVQGFDLVSRNRPVLESQLSGAVREGNPSKGRQILEAWGLWPWVSSHLRESGNFASVREMVLNRDESGLRALANDPRALFKLDEGSLRVLIDMGILSPSEIQALAGNPSQLKALIRQRLYGQSGDPSSDDQSRDLVHPRETYSGQIRSFLETNDAKGLQDFLTRENLTALVLLVAMVLFVLPKRYLRKLLGIRYTFRRRIN